MIGVHPRSRSGTERDGPEARGRPRLATLVARRAVVCVRSFLDSLVKRWNGSPMAPGSLLLAIGLSLTLCATPARAVTRILVSNDDGPGGVGLQALVTELQTIPDVVITIVVPDGDASGTGAGITIFAPLTITAGVPLVGGIDTATTVGGRPADCVRYALANVFPPGPPPDFVISGINRGQNLGAAFGSGTVGAATQASSLGIKAIAVSQALTFSSPPLNVGATLGDYAAGAGFVRRLVQALVANDPVVRKITRHLQLGGMLNVNVPAHAPIGARLTAAGQFEPTITYVDSGPGQVTPTISLPSVDAYNPDWVAQGVGTDVGAVAANYVAVVLWNSKRVGVGRGRRCCDALLP